MTVRASACCAAAAARHPAPSAAATLAAAAAAVGLALDEHVVAALNGDQITRDPETPLVAGDGSRSCRPTPAAECAYF